MTPESGGSFCSPVIVHPSLQKMKRTRDGIYLDFAFETGKGGVLFILLHCLGATSCNVWMLGTVRSPPRNPDSPWLQPFELMPQVCLFVFNNDTSTVKSYLLGSLESTSLLLLVITYCSACTSEETLLANVFTFLFEMCSWEIHQCCLWFPLMSPTVSAE